MIKYTVCFGVNIFHCHLETVKGASFWKLNLTSKATCQILQDNAVGPCEKSEHMLKKMPFVVGEAIPVHHISLKIDLFGGPEAFEFNLFILKSIFDYSIKMILNIYSNIPTVFDCKYLASCFLYISHIAGKRIGNMTHLWLFSFSRSSSGS